jgi:hypothetical protein
VVVGHVDLGGAVGARRDAPLAVQAALGAPPPDPPALALLVHGVHVPLVYHLHPPLVRLDHFDLFLHPVT